MDACACVNVYVHCPGGIGMPSGCGLCGVAGKLDLAPPPHSLRSKAGRPWDPGGGFVSPGKGQGRAPELAQRHHTLGSAVVQSGPHGALLGATALLNGMAGFPLPVTPFLHCQSQWAW